ncbi:MAG: hypothetical protein WBO10_04365 [Pyrinomonadaceae bacterium]
MKRLDADDESSAGEKYQLLVLKLTKFFQWQGAGESAADGLADDAIDRVAAKLEQGVEIENLNAYACQVARFVWLEYVRKNKETQWSDNTPEPSMLPDSDDGDDMRLACLRKCLIEVTAKDESERELILMYYNTDVMQKNKDNRKHLAMQFGMTTNALKVRVCRLRVKLEKCVTECI